MRAIKWTLWEPNGGFHQGDMPENDAQYWLAEFGKEAVEVSRRSKADHVVYGIKNFDEEGGLHSVQFYLLPMDDRDFHKVCDSSAKTLVYAVHRG